jgi:hypothetical protein
MTEQVWQEVMHRLAHEPADMVSYGLYPQTLRRYWMAQNPGASISLTIW